MDTHRKMRLLSLDADGTLGFSVYESENSLPPYAILSHTWGADRDEVKFADIQNNVSNEKPGHQKIRFCGEQARKDGLQYFWIDTCCIDKDNKAELSYAIQSMFRWYRDAARCYVYLDDVSSPSVGSDDLIPPLWEPYLRESRWFERGWTLQELLAPSIVEFFSQEGNKLGSKTELAKCITEITGVPTTALLGSPLSQFSVNDKLQWKEYRTTTRPEDRAYSLLGVLGVYIVPFYGEGETEAFKRLMAEISKAQQCIRDIRNTDPSDDKKRIEDTKGGLLHDSYKWVFDNAEYRKWHSGLHNSRMLWIKGDPGKGKTMLLCGIIDELQKCSSSSVSYFFCQATVPRINNATAVLRGLLYLLVRQQPLLLSSVREKYEEGGKPVFEGDNAWYVLSEIFADVLRNPDLQNTTYLVIDGLDECVTDLQKLLEFIAIHSGSSSRTKWIVSSRNWPQIQEKIGHAGSRLHLELNAESISAAVQAFIARKVALLSGQKNYDKQIEDAVMNHLTMNANDTFLWVALVCQNLETVPKRHVLKKLSTFLPGLGFLYKQMMQQISNSDDAELCRQILATTALVYRPTTLKELATLVDDLEKLEDMGLMEEIIGLCGSFLTLRNGIVYFVHQSAKEFLLEQPAGEVFESGQTITHSIMFKRSLKTMFADLHWDMYELKELGYLIDNVDQPDPCPLEASRYSCIYWIDHLNESSPEDHVAALSEGGPVNSFFEKKYLYWLEALSLCRQMSKGVLAMKKLQSLIEGTNSESSIAKLVYDAYRFIMYHKTAIEHSPLQVYASALLFSPTKSIVRSLYRNEHPDRITIKPAMDDNWSQCLQTLEEHKIDILDLVYSMDLGCIVSVGQDGLVKFWDIDSGTCFRTLQISKGQWNTVLSFAALSPDCTRMAFSINRQDLGIWDLARDTLLHTLAGHTNSVITAAFSPDSTKLASVSLYDTQIIWDTETGVCLQVFRGNIWSATCLRFSPDSARLALASSEETRICDVNSGKCLQKFAAYDGFLKPENLFTSLAFFNDSNMLAIGVRSGPIKIWDIDTGECLRILERNCLRPMSLAFSADSTKLAIGTSDGTSGVWDIRNEECLSTLEGHTRQIGAVAFLNDSTKLATGSTDGTIKIWDIHTEDPTLKPSLKTLAGRLDNLFFSSDSTRVISLTYRKEIGIWDVESGNSFRIREPNDLDNFLLKTYKVPEVIASDNLALLAISSEGKVLVQEVETGKTLQEFDINDTVFGGNMKFSPDSTLLGLTGSHTKVCSMIDGSCKIMTNPHFNNRKYQYSPQDPLGFSNDSTLLWQIWTGRATDGILIHIYDTRSGTLLRRLNSPEYGILAISDDSSRLAVMSSSSTVHLWDIHDGAYEQIWIDMMPHKFCFDLAKPTDRVHLVNDTSGTTELQQYEYSSIGVSSDKEWITYRGKRVVMIPAAYRGNCLAVNEKTAAIACETGMVWFASVDSSNRNKRKRSCG